MTDEKELLDGQQKPRSYMEIAEDLVRTRIKHGIKKVYTTFFSCPKCCHEWNSKSNKRNPPHQIIKSKCPICKHETPGTENKGSVTIYPKSDSESDIQLAIQEQLQNLIERWGPEEVDA